MTEHYFILCAYRRPMTSLFHFEWAPLDNERSQSRRNVIEDICTGQIEHIHKIYHASTEQPLQDVTKEIAGEVLTSLRDSYADAPTGSLNDFLEEQLGCFAFEKALAECA